MQPGLTPLGLRPHAATHATFDQCDQDGLVPAWSTESFGGVLSGDACVCACVDLLRGCGLCCVYHTGRQARRVRVGAAGVRGAGNACACDQGLSPPQGFVLASWRQFVWCGGGHLPPPCRDTDVYEGCESCMHPTVDSHVPQAVETGKRTVVPGCTAYGLGTSVASRGTSVASRAMLPAVGWCAHSGSQPSVFGPLYLLPLRRSVCVWVARRFGVYPLGGCVHAS